jgi:hypothetical protein
MVEKRTAQAGNIRFKYGFIDLSIFIRHSHRYMFFSLPRTFTFSLFRRKQRGPSMRQSRGDQGLQDPGLEAEYEYMELQNYVREDIYEDVCRRGAPSKPKPVASGKPEKLKHILDVRSFLFLSIFSCPRAFLHDPCCFLHESILDG